MSLFSFVSNYVRHPHLASNTYTVSRVIDGDTIELVKYSWQF